MRIPVTELTRISIECSICKTETEIDLSRREFFTTMDAAGNRKIAWKAGERLVCPLCNEAFQSRLTNAVDHFLRWIDAVVESKEKVSFRMKFDDGDSDEKPTKQTKS